MTTVIPHKLLRELTDAVLQRCDELALCSDVTGEVTRIFCSSAMRNAHEKVASWMKNAGLCTNVDSLGNLIGRYEQSSHQSQSGSLALKPSRICIGSHLDSVRNAGRYDGVLGVLLGIAVVEAIANLGYELEGTIDVIGFSEEEGVRYSLPYLGSMAVAGKFDPLLFGRIDAEGVSMKTALEKFGVNPDDYLDAKINVSDYVAYLEAHIEQGPVLDTLQQSVGVVESIVGQSRLWLVVEGVAGHAGTLPMRMRRDALTAAADCVLAIEDYAHNADGLVATVGGFHVSPNATNVVPGHVRFSIDVRHSNNNDRLIAVDEILSVIEEIATNRGIKIDVTDRSDFEAVPMNSKLVDDLAWCCKAALQANSDFMCDSLGSNKYDESPQDSEHQVNDKPLASDVYILSSGAGHDAAVMASVMPSVMLFLHSPGGISHNPLESVRPQDVSIAIDAMCRFVLKHLERK